MKIHEAKVNGIWVERGRTEADCSPFVAGLILVNDQLAGREVRVRDYEESPIVGPMPVPDDGDDRDVAVPFGWDSTATPGWDSVAGKFTGPLERLTERLPE